jgi:hypothetical protein
MAMTQVYFHCSTANGILLDRQGSTIEDLADLHDHAVRVIRGFLAKPIPEDWRNWVLHIRDAAGEEILVVPFSSEIGRLH